MPDCHHHNFTLALAAILLVSLSGGARCQTSADLTLVSEYAGRGVALHTGPALQLRVEHDAADGWYGGAFASPVTLEGRGQGQLTAYGGRAQRLTSATPSCATAPGTTTSSTPAWRCSAPACACSIRPPTTAKGAASIST
jgi:hypothetical protein